MHTEKSYQFYGQFEPPVDKFIFERYFPDPDIKGIFIESGAFDGETECSCKFFEETLGWTGYNFEPVPWIWEKLCTNRPNTKNFNLALSNSSGHATFNAVNHPTFGTACTNGSLMHTEAHKKYLEDNGSNFIDVEVQLITWKEFIEREKISQVDLFVLDVEGHELQVIEGMRGSDVMPGVLCIEVGHLCFDTIRRTLMDLGYNYDISSHVNAYFIHKNYINTVLVRQINSQNKLFSNSSLLKQETQSIDSPHISELQVDNVMESQKIMLNQQQQIQALEAKNIFLESRLHELTALYQAITTSKGWRMLERVKRFSR